MGQIRKHLLAARPTVDEKKDGKEKGKLLSELQTSDEYAASRRWAGVSHELAIRVLSEL